MKVVMIEDDQNITEIVALAFRMRWPEAQLIPANLGEKGIQKVESEAPDLVILDLGLPDISGFDVLEQIRRFSDVPIIIVTVRAEEEDVVKGVEMGADDYVVKPFRQMELLGRARALTARPIPGEERTPLVCGQLRFDPSTRQLLLRGREVIIAATEADIMHQLMKNVGQVVSISRLVEAVWGEDYPGAGENLKSYIRRLREKLEIDPDQPQLILTKPGLGYYIP